MKASDRAALAIGAVGTWIYIAAWIPTCGDAPPWELECSFWRSWQRRSAITSKSAARSRKSGKKSAGTRCLRRGSAQGR